MGARRGIGALAAALALVGLCAPVARAQSPGVEPGEVRPTLPPPRAANAEEPALTLPPLEIPATGGDRIAAGVRVHVRGFVVTGHSAFGDAEIERVLAPWVGRTLDGRGLLAARDAVTALYHERGYVTSGALLPDQDVSAGIVRIVVVEGAVSEIDVEGEHRIRARYLRPRLEHGARAPVQLGRLRRTLEALQKSPWIETIDARLEPTERLGEARLVVTVTEARQWRLGAEVANDRSPVVGSTGGILDGAVANLAGMGDVVSGRFEMTSGYRDVELRLEVPVTRLDTLLRFRFRDTKTEVVESPFDPLDIEGRARTYALSLFQPLWRSELDEVWLQLTFDRSQTSSTILGLAFCFELAPPDCTEPVVTALRAGLQWTRSTRHDVVSLRSLVSVGIDALGASTGGGPEYADGRFVAWLGQAQWAHVLPGSLLASTVLLRGDAQLANDTLLSIERISVGGRRTVRGYRENQLVRDNGAILSGEVRVPVWRTSLGRPIVEVVPFMDWGYAWNVVDDPPTNQLWSVGAGLRMMPREGTLAEFWWGHRIDDRRVLSGNAQDYGIHFRVRVDAPDVL